MLSTFYVVVAIPWAFISFIAFLCNASDAEDHELLSKKRKVSTYWGRVFLWNFLLTPVWPLVVVWRVIQLILFHIMILYPNLREKLENTL